MTAPVVPAPQRNRLGIAALVLVLIAIALPIVSMLVFTIGAAVSGAQGDALGYAVLGAFFFAAGVSALAAPIAIVGIVLAIIALTRAGRRKVQAVVAIVLGIAPALASIGIPAVIDTIF
jgi:hypothetical protein